MPLYDYACRICKHTGEYYATMDARANTPPCEKCGSTITEKVILSAPATHPDFDDFSTENGGKGRFNKQLMTYVTSTQDAVDKARAKGWSVLDRL